ncbi:iron hydrogenase [bacterium]|nr:MAG: iron hydrogenase [bacterium]
MKYLKTIKTESTSLGLSLGKSLRITMPVAIKLTTFASLMFIASFVPAILHVQIITGPIVNATLFISVVFLGAEAAILIGLIPSVIALSFGLLPAILAPMVPFIMISNALLIVIFGLVQKKNYWLAVVSASLIKFIFLFSTSSIVIGLLLKKEVATKVVAMMSWPQLLTALMGGIIAWLVMKTIKK